MPIPDFQTLMRPVLLAHEGGIERGTAELRDTIANDFDITEAERQEIIPSGARLFDNRIGWTLTPSRRREPLSARVAVTRESRRVDAICSPSTPGG